MICVDNIFFPAPNMATFERSKNKLEFGESVCLQETSSGRSHHGKICQLTEELVAVELDQTTGMCAGFDDVHFTFIDRHTVATAHPRAYIYAQKKVEVNGFTAEVLRSVRVPGTVVWVHELTEWQRNEVK